MAYELVETGELTRTADVNIPADEYEADVNRALRKLSKRVKIRGFRKGKIPLQVMRQRYGDSVQRDVVEDLVRKYVNAIVDEAKAVLFISTPEVKAIPVNGSGHLEFTVNLELRPDIDPIGYLGLEVEKPSTAVTDEELETEIENLRKQHAVFEVIETRDKVKKGDFVTFDFHAVGDEEALEQFQGEGAQVEVGQGEAMPGIEEALEGAKFDSEITAAVTTDSNFGVEELQDRTFDVLMQIKKVERRTLPELNDEFATTTGEGETLLELRTKLREKLESKKEHDAGHVAENNLISQLLDQNTFDLPPQFLDEQVTNAVRQQLQQLQQQGMNLADLNVDFEELKDNVRGDRERQIKSEFLLVAIAEKESIKVEDKDLMAYFEHQAIHMGVPAEMLQRYMAQEPQRMQQAAASALIEKTVNHLLAEASLTEGEWPAPEAPAPSEEKKAKAPKKEAKAKAKSTKKADKGETKKAEPKKAAKASGFDADAARAAFGEMKVSDLKELLRSNDLKVGGKKDELVDRLIEAEISA